jgi:hypothetical protein
MPRHTAVPDPTETHVITVTRAAQELTEEQRDRICKWLNANGIDPKYVSTKHAVTIEYSTGPVPRRYIAFHQVHRDEEGKRNLNWKTLEPVAFERTVLEQVPLKPEPRERAA